MSTFIPADLPEGATSITKVTLWVIDGGKVEREVLQHDRSNDGGVAAYQRAKEDLLKIASEIQWLLDNGEKLCPFHPSRLSR
jgi:hypothetical protein